MGDGGVMWVGSGSRTKFARFAGALFVVLVALGGGAQASARSDPCEWSQFGGSSLHHGQACGAVPRDLRLRASVTVDPFVDE